MKILLINKFYHSKHKAGGVGRHILELKKLLEKKHHKVIPFACKDKNCPPSRYSKYFTDYQDLESIIKQGKVFSKSGFQAFLNLFYNRRARKNLQKLLKKEKIDIAHIHNIYHHLSPSILYELAQKNIPVVQTLHDYNLISPNYNLYSKGRIHENCAGAKAILAAGHSCIKNSHFAGLAAALRIYWINLTRVYKKNVNLFIAPSQFIKDKHIQSGFNPKKIKVIPNFLSPMPSVPEKTQTPGNYFVYSGRLSEEKGIITLLEAFAALKKEKLIICGSGPQETEIRSFVSEKNIDNIKLAGFKTKKELFQVILGAKAVIVPSEWYENCPYSILEAMMLGKAVIASNRGGIPELVQNNKTGLLFKPASVKNLKEKIKIITKNPDLTIKMGKRAYKTFKRKYSPETFYKKLLEAYKAFT